MIEVVTPEMSDPPVWKKFPARLSWLLNCRFPELYSVCEPRLIMSFSMTLLDRYTSPPVLVSVPMLPDENPVKVP